jgi:hypothetical protein
METPAFKLFAFGATGHGDFVRIPFNDSEGRDKGKGPKEIL